MEKITAKDIIIILIGIIGTLLLSLLIPQEKLIKFNFNVNDYFWMLALSIIAIIYILYRKTNEINEELIKYDNNQKRLEEKLKIHEQLIDIKAAIKELQKNGNKK